MSIEKREQITLLDGFTLYGTVVKENDAGVWFQTTQKTTFFNWVDIKRLQEVF